MVLFLFYLKEELNVFTNNYRVLTMKFTPRPYQKHIIDHIISHPRCAVYAGMGMGKTSATLAALDFLSMIEEFRVLVLAPLRVASYTWPAEAAKWETGLTIASCTGTVTQRKEALASKADIITCNYENIPWLVTQYRGRRWPFTVIVADESTRLKSFRPHGKTVRARALAEVAWDKVTRFIELTGTPSPNGLLDLWGQMWFLDKGERLGKSYSLYTGTYFREIRVGSSPWARKYTPLRNADKAILKKTSDICLSVRPEDYFSLEAPVEVTVPVRLPTKACEMYDALRRDMLVKLEEEGDTITAANAATLSGKLLQLCAGAVYTDSTPYGSVSYIEYHDEKIQALQSIIAESNGEPVLVIYQWRSDAERILKVIPEAKLLGKDTRLIDEWNAGKLPVMLVHPASAGHGLNLQDGGRIMVVFSPWWDLEQYQQVIERIGPVRQFQSGHPRTVFIYHILAEGTIDEVVYRRRKDKKEIQDCLLEGLKK